MEIYSVKEKYIQYLQKFDSIVCLTKLNKPFGRKYVGIVFEIKDFTYFAPLSSSVYKIIDGKKVFKQHFTDVYLFNGKASIGSVKINNMIPIPRKIEDKLLEPLIFDDFTNSKNISIVQYGNLLKNQRVAINAEEKKQEILDKATSFYKTYKFNSLLQKLCCDFKLLEEKALEFSLSKNKKKEKTIEQEEELVK